ncbi:hypothetical protein [Aestuariibaculum sediminum]|uniref:DUF1566 domain-containing protein n=1 Tax=Aestuariibaculum sediminum TaxID=2770637 RepID=A0A8J6Q5N8_9FLAO|nr:hypothetical protein [Aestuariibaculum sediminum]MBD0830898.1 hypothetical protein [Aestuariibaculum sediminum]
MKINIHIILFTFTTITSIVTTLNSCSKDEPNIEMNEPNTEIVLMLGDNYQGGIIFYLDNTEKHGLIAAKTDQSTTDPWWNGSFIKTEATSNSDGSSNTNMIIQAQGDNGAYAAKLCKDYSGGGFNDWFLPSKDQLNILYEHKALVGGFSNQIYWTSSEYDLGSAWVQDFETGEQHLDNTSDSAGVRTRAIRAF